MTEERERLFFALWPDAGVRAALAAAAAEHFSGSGRPIPPQQFHMTLVFLGEVPVARRPCLQAGAAALTLPAFRLELDRVGWWRRSQVLWVGPSEMPAALTALVARLRGVMTGCGLVPERRPFAAHATLARKVRRARSGALAPPVPWEVTAFALVRSVTHRHGADYTTVASWPLVPGDGAQGRPGTSAV